MRNLISIPSCNYIYIAVLLLPAGDNVRSAIRTILLLRRIREERCVVSDASLNSNNGVKEKMGEV